MKADVKRTESRPDWDPSLGPDLIDRDLERRDLREKALKNKPGKGILAISLEVGDELGELFMAAQFEAMPGDYPGCQEGQNRVLLQGSAWLKEVLEAISAEDAEWDLSIVSRPCPHAPTAPPVEHARKILLGQQNSAEALVAAGLEQAVATGVAGAATAEVRPDVTG